MNRSSDSVYVYSVSDMNRIFSSNYTYHKGAWALHQLRHIVGDATFYQILDAPAAEFAAQNAGERKTDQATIAVDADLYVVLRVLSGVSQPLLEESAARCAELAGIDGNDLFEIGRT